MKVRLTAIVLSLVFLSTVVEAGENSGFYLGIGAGATRLESRVITSSIPPQTQSIKGNSFSVRLFGGYRVLRYL